MIGNINQNKKSTSLFMYIFFTIIIISIDRITKYIALKYHHAYLSIAPRLFHLPPLLNRGVSLELFNMTSRRMFFYLQLLGICILCYFAYKCKIKYQNNQHILGEALIIAGGVGNLIDRIFYKCVIDFIFFKLPIINYIAICNIADFAITIGCFIIVFELLIEKNFNDKATKNDNK